MEEKNPLDAWDHKDVWRRRGKDFSIEVTRHAVKPVDYWEGPHRWNVYAYIYPNHPHFATFSGPSIFQDATTCMHFHRGCSFLEYPMYDGKVTSVKVGSDYHHLNDDRFTHFAAPLDAYEVFCDADRLFEQLQNSAQTVREGE